MKSLVTDKIAGIVFSAVAVASFGIVPQAQANPAFPPQHVAAEATFAPAGEQEVQLASPSWYRAGQPQIDDTDFSVTADNTVASVEINPWYRNAN